VLLQAIESVPSVGHKKGIHYWILKHGGKASLFTLADTQRLDAVFPGVPWRHTPLATLSRHEFVLRSLLNKNYFEQINSYMGPIVDPKNLYVEMTFSDASKHRVNFTKQDLLVYAAHIYAPAPPILELDVPGVKGLVAENVNIEFNKNLRRIGHCNARGHLRPSFFKAKKMTIRTQVLNALESCKVITSNEMRVEYSTKLMHWDHMTFEPQYKSRLKVMDELSGFSACNNLHFFFEFLVATHYGLQEGARVTIRDTIKQCLYYADQAKRILKGKTAIRKMHKDLFVLAKRFITDFVTSKCTRIINVGTPIAPGKTHSEHSIYVVFKFIEPNHVKIIISNGGLGVNQFHRPATAGVERDHEEYDYAAFETLTLTAANQDMLSHYVYRILQIRFMTATDKPGQGKGNGSNRDGNTFDDIVRDIYLRTRQEKEPSYFRGYQFKKFSLQRDDLPQSLLAQFTGNCTLHNLKKALQIGYDMDDTIFGKLEDNLLVGFDQKVTQWGMQLL
jgi:hypothetical protein